VYKTPDYGIDGLITVMLTLLYVVMFVVKPADDDVLVACKYARTG